MTDKEKTVLDTSKNHEILVFSKVMPRVVSEYGKSLGSQLKDLLHLSMRGNHLRTDEYYEMCLFDDNNLSMDEKRKFVGLGKSRVIWSKLNKFNPWIGMMNNKLVFEIVLRGLGIPATETQAIAATNHDFSNPTAVDSEKELEEFLIKAKYPLFGKPLNAAYSLGSAKITGYGKNKQQAELHDGRTIALSDLWHEISNKFEAGYLFQSCLEQNPELQQLTGSGIATVRVLTLDSGNGPEINKAVIKLTGGGNVADNFWRKGNLLAPVDAKTGVMGSALSGMGIEAEVYKNHPDTGKAIAGTRLPHWEELIEMCLKSATLMTDSLIIGFDIALTDKGPLVIEANHDPHLVMMQIAHKEGMLDARMEKALAYADRHVREDSKNLRDQLKQERHQKAVDNKKALALRASA